MSGPDVSGDLPTEHHTRILAPDEYAQKRQQFQHEIKSLCPVDYDDLMEAANLLSNFNHYWQKCENVGDLSAARQQLVARIVDRVLVYDDRVIGIALHGDFGVILNDAAMAPTDVLKGLNEEIKTGVYHSNLVHTQSGSDGLGSSDGRMFFVPQNGVYHVIIRQLLNERVG